MVAGVITTLSFWRRTAYLVLLVGGLGWPLADRMERVRHEHRVREMLLSVQKSLQDYHVDQERYIPRPELSGSDLLAVLSDFGFLDELPLNPWSNTTWKLDGVEPDYLRYQSDANFETYALQALDPRSGEVLMEIDSVAHLSLE